MTILGQSMAPTAVEKNISSMGPYVYITNRDSNTLSVIDTIKDIVTATVKVGSTPWGVAVNPEGTLVYVANRGNKSVSVIDTIKNTVTTSVPVENEPIGVAVTPDGTKVYVTSIEGNVSVIDTAKNNVTNSIFLGRPIGVAVSPDGKKVYVVEEIGSRLYIIDTDTNNILAKVDVDNTPSGVAVDPTGTRVYVTNEENGTVSIIDTATNKVAAKVEVGTYPYGVAVTPDGTKVYVANSGSDNISIIDTETNRVTTVNVGKRPYGVAVTPDGTKAYVANSGSANISVIDIATNNVLTTVTVDFGPIAFGQFIVPFSSHTKSPDITLAHYDKDVLDINWTNPGSYTDFVVELYDTAGTMHYNQPSTGTSATIYEKLDKDKTYIVSVSAIIDGTPGPRSSEVALIVNTPVISLLQYSLENDQGKLETSWEPITDAELYITSVYTVDGSFKQNIPSTTTSCTLESTLNQTKQYKTTVCATANNGIVIGPSSGELSAIIKAPDINLLQYSLENDQGRLDTSWEKITGADLYITSVYTTDGSFKQNITSTTTFCKLESTLDQRKQYKTIVFAMAYDGIVIGPMSNEFTAIIKAPEINLLQYTLINSEGKLYTSWGEIQGAELYITSVYTIDGSFKQNIPSTTTSCTLESTLDHTKQYKTTVCATANDEIVIGPSSGELSAIIKAPDINLLHYSLENDQGRLEISWEEVTGVEYIISAYTTDGSSKVNIQSATTSCKLELTLDQSKQYKIVVCAIPYNAIVIGPSSGELSVIIKAPDINLLQYSLENDQGKLETSWEPVTDAESYITSVYTVDGFFKQNIPSTTTSCTLESTLDQTKQYKTTVCATANNGIVIGPSSGELSAIIVCPGHVNLNNTGQNLRSDWTIPTNLQGKQFNCELYKDNAKLAGQMTCDSYVLFNYSLDAGAIYTSQVRGESGVVKGPWTKLAQGPYAESIVYNYDTLSRLKSITCNNTITVTYTMDNAGNILSIQNNQAQEECNE